MTPNINIRLNREAYHEARVAAVTASQTLGRWLEEAIREKIERENSGER